MTALLCSTLVVTLGRGRSYGPPTFLCPLPLGPTVGTSSRGVSKGCRRTNGARSSGAMQRSFMGSNSKREAGEKGALWRGSAETLWRGVWKKVGEPVHTREKGVRNVPGSYLAAVYMTSPSFFQTPIPVRRR